MTSTNDSTATSETTADTTASAPSAHETAGLIRAWTETGQQLYDRERATREGHNYATGSDVVAAAIDSLEWQTMPASGSVSLPFSPGEGIKVLVAETGLYRVSRIAWNAAVDVRDDAERSHGLYGLYGIEAMQDGFPVRVYAVDRGTDLLIVAVDAPPALALALDATAGQVPTH
ncbi:hypothetical protein [Modestobacter sp. SSW1-42]|uniref:hypothetical protein n=1 Tax=Modestobacter sp. SSW1-42 TaxID=596372 RepID=UPI00398644EE